jgi:hypothetical protein
VAATRRNVLRRTSTRGGRAQNQHVVPPHPINRLLTVADGLRALAAELEEIQGEVPLNLVWWSEEIDRAVADIRRAAGGASRPASPAHPKDKV